MRIRRAIVPAVLAFGMAISALTCADAAGVTAVPIAMHVHGHLVGMHVHG